MAQLRLCTAPMPAGQARLIPGMPLEIQGTLGAIHGLAAPYHLKDLGAAHRGAIELGSSGQVIIWDSGINCADLLSDKKLRLGATALTPDTFTLADNCLRICASSILGPELIQVEDLTRLRMQPIIDLDYQADYFPAQVAELRVVASQRFLALHNGQTQVLTQTDETLGPALVLSPLLRQENDAELLTQLFAPVLLHGRQQLRADTPVFQTIIAEYNGEAVASVTVLEQYTSYFLQRYNDTQRLGCWVPALPPVTWGWSIRVAKNGADEWAIVRRKLMLPTVGHEGLQLPYWQCLLTPTDQGHLA